MTTPAIPPAAALEIARRYCHHPDRSGALAREIAEYGERCGENVLNYARTVTKSREAMIREATMPLHQEDGDAP